MKISRIFCEVNIGHWMVIGLLTSYVVINVNGSIIDDLFGCSCPCRTYKTRRCVSTYNERCHLVDSVKNERKCTKYPTTVVKYVKERECQKCREYIETEMEEHTKLVCNPVYDETCVTSYTPICSYSRKCSMTAKLDCSAREYGAPCQNIPLEKCKKVKKCSKKPQTRCKPSQSVECGLENYMVPNKVKRYKCLGFNRPPPPDEKCVPSHKFSSRSNGESTRVQSENNRLESALPPQNKTFESVSPPENDQEWSVLSKENTRFGSVLPPENRKLESVSPLENNKFPPVFFQENKQVESAVHPENSNNIISKSNITDITREMEPDVQISNNQDDFIPSHEDFNISGDY